jgi:hypothetical protein
MQMMMLLMPMLLMLLMVVVMQLCGVVQLFVICRHLANGKLIHWKCRPHFPGMSLIERHAQLLFLVKHMLHTDL